MPQQGVMVFQKPKRKIVALEIVSEPKPELVKPVVMNGVLGVIVQVKGNLVVIGEKVETVIAVVDVLRT